MDPSSRPTQSFLTAVLPKRFQFAHLAQSLVSPRLPSHPDSCPSHSTTHTTRMSVLDSCHTLSVVTTSPGQQSLPHSLPFQLIISSCHWSPRSQSSLPVCHSSSHSSLLVVPFLPNHSSQNYTVSISLALTGHT